MKMTRDDVYVLIDQERAYQEKWDKVEHVKRVKDKDKEVEAWLLAMDVYLKDACRASLDLDKTQALDLLRKVLGLGVACMEFHGGPSREE